MGQEEPPHKGERLNIAIYNVRTLLKDEHVQDELKENNMKWDVIGLGEVRRKEEIKFHNSPKWPPAVRL